VAIPIDDYLPLLILAGLGLAGRKLRRGETFLEAVPKSA